ncbi:MAG: prepilin-type N-terminal cleavage/methylation domain-containing protein [Betaproteobacteria bacterium]
MSSHRKQKYQRGLSLFELIAAIAIISVVAGVLLQRMFYLQEYAEMTAMQLTVTNLRTGLRYKTGELLIAGRVSEIATLADGNPVQWLQTHPENYLGDFDLKPESDLRGKWYFDKSRHELVYTINNRRHFLPKSDRDYTYRWQVVRQAVAGQNNPGIKSKEQWVALVQIAGGQWF